MRFSTIYLPHKICTKKRLCERDFTEYALALENWSLEVWHVHFDFGTILSRKIEKV